MIGTLLAGRYEILSEIGRGGMGVVYQARDRLLERDVAIKTIHPSQVKADSKERFKREARMVAQLDHPAIIPVHDVGEEEDYLYLIMPFVKGTNLRTLIEEGPLTLRDVLDIGIAVAEALGYSHSRGIIHRDIKPENILITREEEDMRVRITDFGLARTMTKERRLTDTGAVVGTVVYLSPEQISNKQIDGRSDLYSLGTVLYESLSGRTPFHGDVHQVLYNLTHDIPRPPSSMGIVMDPELEIFIMNCLEKDPALRPQRGKDCSETLQRIRMAQGQQVLNLSVPLSPSSDLLPPPPTTVLSSPFIGRTHEMTELARRLNAVDFGECHLITIGGEEGVGKTRLLGEFEKLARSKKIPVLHGRFQEHQIALPYQAFCEVIQEYFFSRSRTGQSSPADFYDLSQELVSCFPLLSEIKELNPSSSRSGVSILRDSLELPNPQNRMYLFELLSRCLIRMGTGNPIAFFFEDLHYADMSLEALGYLVRRVGMTPFLIVCTYRTGEIDKKHPLQNFLDSFSGNPRFSNMILRPFSSVEHLRYVESLMHSDKVDDVLAAQIFEVTEGNPYFTSEILRSIGDADRKNALQDLRSTPIPPEIQQVVERRIDRLSGRHRDVLSLASLVGKSFQQSDIESITDESTALEDILDDLVEEGFLEEVSGTRQYEYLFSSRILHDVVYGSLPRSRRKRIHLKYARFLEKQYAHKLEQVYPQLVHHYTEGDDREKAIDFGMKLARKSLQSFSFEEVAKAAQGVLDLLTGETEGEKTIEGEARLLLCSAYRVMGKIDAAMEEVQSALQVFEETGSPAEVARGMWLAAETAWQGRRIEQTRLWVEQGLPVARSAQTQGVLHRLLMLGATVANLRCEFDIGASFLREAESLIPESPEEEVVPKDTQMVVGLPMPVRARHPATTDVADEIEVLSNVFETLVISSPKGLLLPGLCERWESPDQGLSFVFLLRSGIRAHDGRRLTAREIKKSWEASIRLASHTLPRAFSEIRGVQEFLDGTQNHVAGILAVFDDRLAIQLRERLPIFPSLLTDKRTAVAIETSPGEFAGTGPYRFSSFTLDRIILQPNPYSASPPAVSSLEFRTSLSASDIETGIMDRTLDVASGLLPEHIDRVLRKQPASQVLDAPMKNVYFVLFNRNTTAGASFPVRMTLSGLIQPQEIVRRTLGRLAEPAVGVFPPGILGHRPERRARSLPREQAIRLLKSSGFELPLKLKAAVHPVFLERYAALLNELRKTWRELGIEINIAGSDMSSYLEAVRNSDGVDLLIGRWVSDYDDPDDFSYGLFHSTTGEFRHYIASEDLDELAQKARLSSDPDFRELVYREYEDLLLDRYFILPLCHDNDCRYVSSLVKNVRLSGSPPYMNYSELFRIKGETLKSPAVLSRKEKVLHVPIPRELRELDPALIFHKLEGDVLACIFDTLTREGEGAQIMPWLVSGFESQNHGRRFHFRLRDNVRFQDGRRVTARDVRYTFERALSLEESQSRAWYLTPVLGGQNLLDGKTQTLEGFHVLSDTEFAIDLIHPLTFFPAILVSQTLGIVPEGFQQKDGDWRSGNVGTGPFRIVHYQTGKVLELEANPHYWRKGFPRSRRLIFHFGVSPEDAVKGFQNGRFSVISDLAPSDVDLLLQESKFASRLYCIPSLVAYYVLFNIHRKPMSDVGNRMRMIEGLDVPALIQNSLGRLALPAGGIIPPGLLGHESLPRKRLRSGANVRPDPPLEISGMMHSAFDVSYTSFAEVLLKTLQEKGFRVHMNPVRSDVPNALISAEVDLILSRWVADYPDADSFAHNLLHSKEGEMGRFCGGAELDYLIEAARIEEDPRARHHLYREMEDYIFRNALLLPLFYEQSFRFLHPNLEPFDTHSLTAILPYERLKLL